MLHDDQRPYTNGGWTDISGTDGFYGLTNPRSPSAIWGGTTPVIDSIQLINDNLSDFGRQIVTDNSVPAGVSNKVLQLSSFAPEDPNVGGQSGQTAQNSFITWPDTSKPQGMLYFSKWMWLPNDMASRSFQWFVNTETKTDSTERFGSGLSAASYNGFGGQPVWQLTHDHIGYGGPYRVYAEYFLSPSASAGNMAPGQTYYAPVPFGQWFRVELAWNRNVGGTGWIWMALTIPGSSDAKLRSGVQVYAGSGSFNFNYNGSDPESLGWNSATTEAINRIFAFLNYSDIARSASNPFSYKLTNMEVWTKWPATATAHPANFN